mgnify:FL=1
MYIGEIEKANNFLKLHVCQKFESLHINDKAKQEFVEKIQNLENKPYFHRKLAMLECSLQTPDFKPQPSVVTEEVREARVDKK